MKVKSKEKIRKIQNAIKNSKDGITLLSLVITIIVLIILACASIQLVLSDNGILTRAKEVGNITKKASLIEEIKLKILDQQTQGIAISKANLLSMLSMYGTVIEENGQMIAVRLKDGNQILINQIYTGVIIEDSNTYIYTKEQLETFRDNVNNGKTYENETIMLMNNIDLQGNENDEETWWTPIGKSSANPFKGIFDGNHHKINGIYIYQNEGNRHIGFFANIYDASIKNTTISGIVLADGKEAGTLNNPSAGGLVGYSLGTSLIENCRNETNVSEVSGTREAAGILGGVAGNVTIINCSNVGNIIGGNNCAGIAGYTKGKIIIENSYNEGNIINYSGDNTGGLIAKNVDEESKIIVKNCYNIGKVEGTKQVGGCIGKALGPTEINTFYNAGNINSEEYEAGGIIGWSNINIRIENAYNKGNIKSYRTSGGMIGYSGQGNIIINNAYNIGNITSEDREAGGMIGDTDAINYLINVYNAGKCISHTTRTTIINGSSGGIIGSSYSSKAEITIINAYNTANIEADKNASGIVGGVMNINSSKIENVYNKGNLIGNVKCGIITLSKSTIMSEGFSISNAYYQDNAEVGTNLENDHTTKITEEYMNSKEFVNKLNQYVENKSIYKIDENTSIKLLKWKLGEEGYPIFE